MMMPKEIEADMASEMAGPGAQSTELCVPSTALEMGEGADKAAPEVGDSVDFSATGRVSRVEGGHIYVDVSTVNDQPIAPMKKPEGEEEPDGDEVAQLDADVENARMQDY